MQKKYIIYSLGSNPQLYSDLLAGSPFLIPGRFAETKFVDGEMKLRALDDVHNHDIVVLQSSSTPIGDNLLRILIFTDSLVQGGAASITLIAPYFAYTRQDRAIDINDPLSLKMVTNILNAAGISKIIFVDAHAAHAVDYFPLPTVSLSTEVDFANYYLELFKNKNINLQDVVILAPDHGSINRGRALRDLLPGSAFATIEKVRPAPDMTKIISFHGSVAQKTVIIYDDILDTGQTVFQAIQAVRQKGAAKVFLAISHPLFSRVSFHELQALKVDGLVVSNSLEQSFLGKVPHISLARLILGHLFEDQNI